MKQRLLVSIIIILVVALSYFSYVYRSSTDAFTQQMNDAKEYRTDDYHIAIAFKDDLPAVGNNTAILRLRDTKGNPIPEATIRGHQCGLPWYLMRFLPAFTQLNSTSLCAVNGH